MDFLHMTCPSRLGRSSPTLETQASGALVERRPFLGAEELLKLGAEIILGAHFSWGAGW